jgi:crotonobetainyl-CoA:carnitine CoA-transferase CaiB-like acyl-CoA transferase
VLSGLRIIELGDERGYLAGKILADMGAEVVKVEPPGGDPGRRRGSPVSGETSVAWLAMNTSKRSVVLDLGDAADAERLRGLLAGADVLLETLGPKALNSLGFSRAALTETNARLVHCSITPFGTDGPRADFRGHDLVVVAMGGNAAMTGDPAGPPLRCTLPTSHFHAGPEAVVGILTALLARERSGAGDFVDVSMQECQLATTMAGPGSWALSHVPARRAGARIGRTREIWRAADGWITFGLRGGPARVRNLIATTEYMRECGMLPAWMREYDWQAYDHVALDDAEIARLEQAFGAFFATKSMRELYEQALARRILLAPCNDAKEILEHAQLRSRELFEWLRYAGIESGFEQPDRFARTACNGVRIRRPAPRVGEHQDLFEHAADAVSAPSPNRPAAGRSGAPFDGLAILELGSGAAGPVATRYFADRGATVVRIESSKRPDFLRLLHMRKDSPYGLDGSPMFILLNPNKKSIALDMSKPEGIEVARRLAGWADIVIENFAPGVMEKWGLDGASLRAMKPRLITVSGSLFGLTGPQRSYPGFGGQGSAIAGFNHLTGRPDGEAHGPYGTITDSLAPRYLAALMAAALLRRERLGEGESIDLSQIESGVYSLSEMIARYSATGESLRRNGNHDEHAVPHAIYPCAGEDRWIAIAVHDDAEWRRLCEAMGAPTWALAERYATADGRRADEQLVDENIAEWTRDRDAFELMDELQAAGVEAGVVQTFADLLEDPQLAHRGHFVVLEHEHLGPMQFEHCGYRIQGSPARIVSPGPHLGAHTDEVLRESIGLSDAEIAELRDREVLS